MALEDSIRDEQRKVSDSNTADAAMRAQNVEHEASRQLRLLGLETLAAARKHNCPRALEIRAVGVTTRWLSSKPTVVTGESLWLVTRTHTYGSGLGTQFGVLSDGTLVYVKSAEFGAQYAHSQSAIRQAVERHNCSAAVAIPMKVKANIGPILSEYASSGFWFDEFSGTLKYGWHGQSVLAEQAVAKMLVGSDYL